MMERRIPRKGNLQIRIYYFVILWYFFFSASVMLRPYVAIFWPTMALVGILLFRRDVQEYVLTKYDCLCLVAILTILVSILSSVDQQESFRYAMLFILFFVIAHLMTLKMENMDLLIQLMLLYACFMCFVTLLQVFQPQLYLRYFLPLLPSQFWEHTLNFMNNGAFVGFANQTSGNAFALSIGIGALCYRIIKNPGSRLNYLLMGLFLFALLFTQRRGSTIEVAVLLILFLLRFKRNKLSVLLATALSTMILLYIGLENIPGISTIVEKFSYNQGDFFNGRLQIWKETLGVFAQRPVYGYGINTYSTYFSGVARSHSISSAHNSYIQMLFEIGIVGAILYLMPFLFGFFRTTKAFLQRNHFEKGDFALLSFSFFIQAYCFINAAFEGLFASEQSVFLLFMVQLMAIKIIGRATNQVDCSKRR